MTERDEPRWKLACINWGHADAPKALTYLATEYGIRHERYWATFAEAVAWLDRAPLTALIGAERAT